jgi:uncharacterized iron-regulated membrane protein
MPGKRWWLQFHVWLGLIVGLFWGLQGLTGALLVFNRDVQGAAYSASSPQAPVGMLPLDSLFSKASLAAGSPVTKIETFGARPYFVLAYYEDRHAQTRTFVVDGRSGRILDDRSTDELLPHGSGFWPWLLRFHEAMLGGDRGQYVVGTSGLLLLFSLAIGIWNGIPAGGRIRAAFRISRWRTTLQRFLGWHRMLGLLFGLPLLVTVLCGIYLAFAPAIRPVLAHRAGYVPAYQAHPQASAPRTLISAEQAWQAALRQYPKSRLVRAVLPSAKSPVYLFRLLKPGEWRRWAGTSWVAVNPQSGKIIASYDAVNGPLANRITDNLYTIHTGEAGGLVARLLVLFDGLLLPAFFVTGFVTWRRRSAARKTAAAKQRKSEQREILPVPANAGDVAADRAA